MRLFNIILFFILIQIFIGCGCEGIICGPCQGPPQIANMNSPIIKFDTSNNNYSLNDIDTLLLFKDEIAVASKTPSDSFFNTQNIITINGLILRSNIYISDENMAKFIKIDNLTSNLIEKGKGCCGCDKLEGKSININDSACSIFQLPILIKK
jgi:hypothetical protein